MLRIQERGRSNHQHYGATDSPSVKQEDSKLTDTSLSVIDDADYTEIITENQSKLYLTFVAVRQKLLYRFIELWNRLMSISYVFTLVAMMVRNITGHL